MANQLANAGVDFRIVGNTKAPAAYKVAAGVINPVTGRWMTKSWEIDQLLPVAESTYRTLEREFDATFYHPVPLLRYCQNAADAKRLGRRMRNPRYANVLGNYVQPGTGHPSIRDTQGSFEIKHAAYVNLPKLLEHLQTQLRQEGRLIEQTFAHTALRPQSNAWNYQNITAQRVIFCEGVGIRDNPWFRHLPLTPAKGETLILRDPELELPETLYHHKKWILPYGDHRFRIGATYDESDLSNAPTPAGREELMTALHEFILPEVNWQLEAHLAGIRPTTSDAKPLLGSHPTAPNLYLLNGLGSKGASLAPLMSEWLFAHIYNGAPLPESVDIRRFDAPCD